MSGHSKWATIKRKKGINDAKRSNLFGKLSKDITVAARISETSDVNLSPLLKIAVDKAKAANMTSDTIEKAIKKGLGESSDNQIMTSKTYEAYTKLGVGILIETETDNSNRTLTDVRTIVNKSGGKLLSEGSLSWNFNEVGIAGLKIVDSDIDTDILQLEILDLGLIKDLVLEDDQLHLITEKQDFRTILNKLKEYKSLELIDANIAKLSNSGKLLTEDQHRDLETLTELLEEINEVTNIWIDGE